MHSSHQHSWTTQWPILREPLKTTFTSRPSQPRCPVWAHWKELWVSPALTCTTKEEDLSPQWPLREVERTLKSRYSHICKNIPVNALALLSNMKYLALSVVLSLHVRVPWRHRKRQRNPTSPWRWSTWDKVVGGREGWGWHGMNWRCSSKSTEGRISASSKTWWLQEVGAANIQSCFARMVKNVHKRDLKGEKKLSLSYLI